MSGILDRQLRRLGLDEDTAPDLAQWRSLLERVRRTYSDFEQDRYTIERSLEITSREMLSLNEDLRRACRDAESASRAKGDFLAVMSHEIRTPMNAILGMTGLLLDSALTDEQHDHADTVRRASEALLTILDDVLDFSKVESGHLTLESIDFDLAATFDDVAAIFEETARRSGVELVLWVDPEAPTRLRGDPSRLRQILVNLVGNALKFTERGEVVVRARRDADGEGLLRFEVRDTGVGIAPSARAALFQPFSQADSSTTRRYGGTGLGLAISRRLAELMGGAIGVESAPGEGSTFWFTARFGLAEVAEPSAARCLAGRRVLVVDARASVRALLGDVLGHEGAVVDCVAELDRAAVETPWDAVLVDGSVRPAERHGIARALRAQAHDGGPRVMLLGVAPTDDDVAAGIRTHLRTPLRARQIARRIAGALAHESVATRPTARPSNAIATLDGAAGRRVLVVEDNAVNQKVITRILAKLGLDCDVAANGIEALAAVERGAYDVILMDCQMPEMDGYATTRRIRAGERTTRVPIVAMTAHCLDGDRARCLHAGMDDYLPKPVALGPLTEVLRRWLSLV